MVCKGGLQKNCLKSSSDTICNNANIKNSLFKVLKIQIFPGQDAPGPPYFIIHPTATLPNTYTFITKYSQGNVNSFLASARLIYKQLKTVSKIIL